MKASFPTLRHKSYREKADKLVEVLSEVPVTVRSRDSEEIFAQLYDFLKPIREFPLHFPPGSSIEVHDSTLCSITPGEDWRKDGRQATLTYIRPASQTGTKNLTYKFPIFFDAIEQSTIYQDKSA